MPTPDLPPSPVRRPAGIWFYAAVLVCLGGVILAYSVLLLPTVGMHVRMWLPLLYILVMAVAGSLCAALGAGLWSRVRLAWTVCVCLSGGGGLYAFGLSAARLWEQVAAGIPPTQHGIPWRTTLVLALVCSYLYHNKDVRAFFGVPVSLPRSGRLRLAAGGVGGVLVALGVHGLLLVTMQLFPGGDPLAGAQPIPGEAHPLPPDEVTSPSGGASSMPVSPGSPNGTGRSSTPVPESIPNRVGDGE